MKTLILKIAAVLLFSLAILNQLTMMTQEVFSNTYWQVEEIRESDIYYIHWKVEANTDSLQFIYHCGEDTAYSEIKKSTNESFSDSHKSECIQKTKVVIDPFIQGHQYIEIIDIPFITSLPDSL